MKVLISLTYYLPNISGLTIYAQRLAEALAKKGHTITILTSQHKKNLPREKVINKVKIKSVPVTVSFGKGVLMSRFPFVAVNLIRKVDVVNIHLPQFEGVVLAILAKIYGKRLVLTHHTDLSVWPGFLNKVSITAVFISQFITGLLADKIVVYTLDYAQYSYYLRLFKHKLVQIYPPIKAQNAKRKTQSAELERLKNIKGAKIGFAGRIAKQKGIPYLLNAIVYLKKNLNNQFNIVFAGPDRDVIGENYAVEIKELIEKYKRYLIFLGKVEPKEMTSFYENIDVLVLPSDDRLESFGIVQVEAMLCATPVVAVDLPGVRVPIQKTGMGKLVPIRNSQDLASGIVAVLKNRKKYIKPQEKIEQIFNYKQTIKAYEKLLTDKGY